jgi:hypothetical protein
MNLTGHISGWRRLLRPGTAALLLVLTAVLCPLFSSQAATITGLVYSVDNQSLSATPVRFTPLSTPLALNGRLLTSLTRQASTDLHGAFNVQMLAGTYRVEVGRIVQDTFHIFVPTNEPATWNYLDLLTNANVLAYSSPGFITKTVLTNKGDLLVRGATDIARLGVGTNGQTIIADSTQALGIKWAAAASGQGLSTNWVNGSPVVGLALLNNTNTTWSVSGSNVTVRTLGYTGNLTVMGAGGVTNLFKFSDGLVTNVVVNYYASDGGGFNTEPLPLWMNVALAVILILVTLQTLNQPKYSV